MDIIKERFQGSQFVRSSGEGSFGNNLYRSHATKYLLMTMLLIAFLPRLWLLANVSRIGLGVDELQSVTYANLPLGELLQSVKLFDPHPPLYYIQLHFWMYLGSSDLWLKSNSVLWSVLTIVSLYFIASRIFNRQVALLAGTFFSIAAFSISYSVEVRMYAFLMLLGVWVYYFTHQIRSGRNVLWTGLGLLLTQLAFLYTHGAGFLIYASVISYAIPYALFRKRRQLVNANDYIVLGTIQIMTLIVYLPWIFRAIDVHVGHTIIPGLRDLAVTFAQLLFGAMIVMVESQEIVLGFALILMVLISVLIFINRKSRILAVAFVIIPVIVTITVSHLVRPIWVTWTLAYVLPFLSLGIAIFTAEILNSITALYANSAKLLSGMLLVGILWFSSLTSIFYQQYSYSPWSPLKSAIELVTQNANPGDIILVPQVRVFWGVSWYYLGPGSFHPLEPDYLVPTEDGVWLISAPELLKINGDGLTYWIIYRMSDDTSILEKYDQAERQVMGTYNNVIVERVQISE